MSNIYTIRNQFPALQQEVYGKPLVYFDNAATSQRPKAVINLINKMNSATNANVHRAIHKLSIDATELYEAGRNAVKMFINAPKRENIVLTSGTTAAINLVASSFSWQYLGKGDVVIISATEHHSNIVPWQLACERTGAILKVIPRNEDGHWDLEAFDKMLDTNVKMVAVGHVSNVLGLENPIKYVIDKAHSVGAQVLIDGAQGIVHCDVDVQALDCDYYAFSGHKLYAATGIGVLYGKEDRLNDLNPYMGGGEMIDTVTFAKSTYAPLPLKFEAGTPNFVGAASFAPAVNIALKFKEPEIKAYADETAKYLFDRLSEEKDIRIYGEGENKVPVYSFNVKGIYNSDLAQIMDKLGVAVRSGHMCAEPLVNSYGETGMMRASLAPYNTKEDVDIFMNALHKAEKMLR